MFLANNGTGRYGDDMRWRLLVLEDDVARCTRESMCSRNANLVIGKNSEHTDFLR